MTIELFCRVVDNYGDAGVCGRLALQLADEHGCKVRLWIDRPEVLVQLRIAPHANVTVALWAEPFDVPPDFGDIVIETFACGTPPEVLAAMRGMKNPVWVNLEYLSAEAWVEGAHLKPSTHPSTGLIQHFFLPGFTPHTGGLLRERDLFAQRDTFRASQPAHEGLRLSLFCYPSAPVQPLLEALRTHTRPVHLLMPEGQLPELTEGTSGSLTLERFPFLPQAEFDHLLWSCDLNFVRGEDSWIRAQWAGKPFIWQAYPQAAAAHTPKIDAFLALYAANLSPEHAETLALAHGVWNLSHPDAGRVWPALLANLPTLSRHAETWAAELGRQADLASQLTGWIEQQRIKS